ncbi:hypothetical protein D9M68_818770 [compost metagenome]
MFAYLIYGSILDQYPGQEGYTYVFSLMSLLAVIGFLVSSLLQRTVRKHAASQSQAVAAGA